MLEVKNLSKKYMGNKVVDDISFNCESGKIFGLLGTNGAGKTTTIRMILEIIKKDTGSVSLNGERIYNSLSKVGYLPEERGLYNKLPVGEQLIYLTKLKGLSAKEAMKNVKYYFQLFKIQEYFDKTAETLSKGNQQKVQIISALAHNPDLIIFDEPFSGLDPVNIELLSDIIDLLKNQNKTIIISSHMMNQVERFCEDIILIKKGKTMIQGNLDDIKSKYNSRQIILEVNKDISNTLNTNNLNYTELDKYAYKIFVKDEHICNKLIKDIVNCEVILSKYEIITPSLNDIFLDFARDSNE